MILGVAAFALLVSVGIIVMERIADVPLDYMTEDPLQTAALPFYTGLLSNLGAMLWAGAAAVCALGAFLVWRQGRLFWFFLGAASLTAWFGLDDTLLFHDQFLRYYVGIPEKPIFAAYVLIVAAFFLIFRKEVLQDRRVALLLFSSGCLGVAIAVDVMVEYNHLETLIEDCFKFAGIAYWFAYFFIRVLELARGRVRAAASAD